MTLKAPALPAVWHGRPLCLRWSGFVMSRLHHQHHRLGQGDDRDDDQRKHQRISRTRCRHTPSLCRACMIEWNGRKSEVHFRKKQTAEL